MLPLFTQGGGRAERGRWGRSWRDCSEAEKNEGGVSMKRSTDRILTTHTGSLPRANDLTVLLEALDAGTVPEQAAFDARVRRAVGDIVRPGSGDRPRCRRGPTGPISPRRPPSPSGAPRSCARPATGPSTGKTA